MSAQLVHVIWFDSETLTGWHANAEIERSLERTHTVGFLVDETEAFLIVAHSCDKATDSYNGVITIPRPCVDEMRTLCRIKCG